MRTLLLLCSALFFLQACKNTPAATTHVKYTPQAALNPEAILKVDLNQDLSKLSLQDLRLLKTSLYARQGFCIMEADLRGYFSSHMPAYDSIMEARYWAEDAPEQAPPFPPIQFTAAEKVFMAAIDSHIQLRLKNNYTTDSGRKLANVNNIVNMFQLQHVPDGFMDKLANNNFVVVPGSDIQLFHVYEENDYRQMPNFITTDMYLQLLHTYFEYILKSVEKEKFMPLLTTLCDKLYAESMQQAAIATTPEVKQVAEFNAVYFAIPYYILSGNKKQVPAAYKAVYENELENIKSETDAPSDLMKFEFDFPYSLFKPRGHYTRKTEFQKYFKAMMWLQTAVMCREETEQLKRATFMATLLNNTPGAMQSYLSVYEPIVYLIGEPDNLSVADICSVLKQQNITSPDVALGAKAQGIISDALVQVAKTRNVIKPKIQLSCPDKINFMPQRYLPDNEVLGNMVDITKNAERAYPKGLDVFAAFNSGVAEDILLNEDKDPAKWDEYNTTAAKQKNKFSNYNRWDASTYNQWLQALVTLQQPNKDYPAFMQTRQWGKKNLNTALASWAELKHDAILYGEQPMGAECGGGGPPDPICVGYVEPNTAFWQALIKLLQNTNAVLAAHNVVTTNVADKSKEMIEHITALLEISNKELKGEKLTEQEYKTIEVAGSSTEYLTLSILDPEQNFERWDDVKGPDRSVAVVADVYTRNISGCNKNGILHEATGLVNDIYVVVEIEGYLYLTKGAVFSYYEFVRQPGERLTDEQWQEILDKGNAPAIPQWMQELILPSKDKPAVDEKIFYSSGC